MAFKEENLGSTSLFMCNIQPQRQQAMLKFAAFETLNLVQRVSIANFHCFLDKLFFFDQIKSKSCFKPGKGGLGSTKFVAFETLAWHNECFFCHLCKDSMVGKGFIQVKFERRNEQILRQM